MQQLGIFWGQILKKAISWSRDYTMMERGRIKFSVIFWKLERLSFALDVIRFRLSAKLLAEKCVLKCVGFKNQLFKNGPIDDVIMTSYHQSNIFFRYFNTHPKRLSSQRVVIQSSNLFRSPDIPCNRWVENSLYPSIYISIYIYIYLYIYPYIPKKFKTGFLAPPVLRSLKR